jgi:hypothetical protein
MQRQAASGCEKCLALGGGFLKFFDRAAIHKTDRSIWVADA